MARFGDWKIGKVNGGDGELYDLAKDPTELDNRAEAMPGNLKTLAARYESWLGSAPRKKPSKRK